MLPARASADGIGVLALVIRQAMRRKSPLSTDTTAVLSMVPDATTAPDAANAPPRSIQTQIRHTDEQHETPVRTPEPERNDNISQNRGKTAENPTCLPVPS